MSVSDEPDPNSASSNNIDSSPVTAVNRALRGPVLDILIANIPGLEKIERERVYRRILGSPALADACFSLFRRKPEIFRPVMLGAKGQPVADENALLSCGRTLAQVIALVVRAVAKRYFRAYFEPRPKTIPPAPSPKPGLLKTLFNLGAPPSPAPQARPVQPRRSRSDELFAALGDFLLYEWQLLLIPHYAPLPVGMVRSLGPRILSFRDPAELGILVKAGPEATALIERADAEYAEKVWKDTIDGEHRDHNGADTESWKVVISREDLES